jgi:hypothetical protein
LTWLVDEENRTLPDEFRNPVSAGERCSTNAARHREIDLAGDSARAYVRRVSIIEME